MRANHGRPNAIMSRSTEEELVAKSDKDRLDGQAGARADEKLVAQHQIEEKQSTTDWEGKRNNNKWRIEKVVLSP